jgi:hypothetical protein
MTGSGTDITGPSDEFHYAYKMLNGPGTIVARVESMDNTDGWAKAGVMIRETLEPDSSHAMSFVTPGNGAVFEYRPAAGQDNVGNAGQQTGVSAPYWVKLERGISGLFTASHSNDGSNWQVLGAPSNVQMNANVHIGLALTSHDAAATCQAVFSNVTITGNVSGAWMNQDIGIQSNAPEPMYVAIANSTGAPAVVYHDDPDATQIDTWTEWNIDLKDFQDKGVNLTDVDSIALGFGDRNNPQVGGSGKMYFDDVRLYLARYVPGMGTPRAGDLSSDGVVDYIDLEIMAGDWGQRDQVVTPVDPTTANLMAYYSLDEGAGTIAGDSAGANNGTVAGGAQWVTGPDGFGSALLFDGTGSQYVDLGTWDPSAGTGQLTISLWANWSGISGQWMGLIGKRDTWAADDMMWQIEAAQGDGNVSVSRESGQTVGGFIAEVGQWEHIAFTFDGTSGTLYRDGMAVGSGAWSLGPDTDAAMVFGACQANGGNPYNGALDEVRMYNRALSQAEIAYVISGGATALHIPVLSVADLYDGEPEGSKAVNFKDFAVLADQWLEKQVWPEW